MYRSTNGGIAWTRAQMGSATDLEVDPLNFNRQYAGISTGSTIDGVYRSTDAGATWTILPGTPWLNTGQDDVGRVELAMAQSNPDVLFVSIQAPGANGLLGLWRTANAWATVPTWTKITNQPGYCVNQCWYNHELLVKPTDANILFAGGEFLYRYNVSTNAWTYVGNSLHLDQHAMAWAGSRLIVGNDGGVFSSINDGSSWSSHNQGLAITEFYYGSLHPTDANVVQGGSQDNGSSRRPSSGGTNWPDADPPAYDGADNFFTDSNPGSQWLLSSQNLSPRRFKNGEKCSLKSSFPDTAGAPFIATIEKCPWNDEVALAGSNNVWKTTQLFAASCTPGPQWTKPCANDPDGGEYGLPVEAIAFAPSVTTCNTFAFGSNAGHLRMTNDGGNSCTDLDPSNQVRNSNVSDIAMHPCFGENPSRASNTETLYVSVGVLGGPHVYKSTDVLSGRHWTDVTPVDGQGVPFDIMFKSILVDP